MTAWTDPKDSCKQWWYVEIFQSNEMIILVTTIFMIGGYDSDWPPNPVVMDGVLNINEIILIINIIHEVRNDQM